MTSFKLRHCLGYFILNSCCNGGASDTLVEDTVIELTSNKVSLPSGTLVVSQTEWIEGKTGEKSVQATFTEVSNVIKVTVPDFKLKNEFSATGPHHSKVKTVTLYVDGYESTFVSDYQSLQKEKYTPESIRNSTPRRMSPDESASCQLPKIMGFMMLPFSSVAYANSCANQKYNYIFASRDKVKIDLSDKIPADKRVWNPSKCLTANELEDRVKSTGLDAFQTISQGTNCLLFDRQAKDFGVPTNANCKTGSEVEYFPATLDANRIKVTKLFLQMRNFENVKVLGPNQ